MSPLATIPQNNPRATNPFAHTHRAHPGAARPKRRLRLAYSALTSPARRAINPTGSETTEHPRAFTPLIDARAASGLLGVPYTWLLAQAREGRIPHHRLGHYVRFNPEDLKDWLQETKLTPGARGLHRR
jgi:excisionase family DNA binding protein